MSLAPIVLFVYNRPVHTKQTVDALRANAPASSSELFIYSDGAKGETDAPMVNKTKEYIKTISGFKKIHIINNEQNIGLDNSVVNGVTEVINKYGKAIVIEDDIVTSPYFLKYMNEALDFYNEEKKVWHIAGWNYDIKPYNKDDVFLWRLMNCWGWATWADRWNFFEKDIDKFIKECSRKDIKRFNLDSTEFFWGQLMLNKLGIMDTWDIRWYATIFKQNGLCLNPVKTFVRNIGLDGSGTHCGNENVDYHTLNMNNNIRLVTQIEESNVYVRIIKKYLKKNIIRQIKWKIYSKIISVLRIFQIMKEMK